MKNFEDLMNAAKLQDLFCSKREVVVKEDEGKKVLWVLAIIGAIATVAAIAVVVYKYLSGKKEDDFEDDFDDDFDDDFFDDDFDDEVVEEEVLPEEDEEV